MLAMFWQVLLARFLEALSFQGEKVTSTLIWQWPRVLRLFCKVLSPSSLILIQQNLPLFCMYIWPVLEVHLNFFGQGDCKDPLKTSESGNLPTCVQGAQDHCSVNAEALKIGPLKYCQHKSLRTSRRHLELDTPLCHFCINGQIVSNPFCPYTVLYLLCGTRFHCILTIYEFTWCRVCAYCQWASKTELALQYWATCHKILENVHTPDTKYFIGVFRWYL